jgi:hypothetical protein
VRLLKRWIWKNYFNDIITRKCGSCCFSVKAKDVEPHAHIDGGDILNFLYYNLLPQPSFQMDTMGAVFFGQICDYNTHFHCGL